MSWLSNTEYSAQKSHTHKQEKLTHQVVFMYSCAYVCTYTIIIINNNNTNKPTLRGKMDTGDIGGSRHGGG